MVTQQELFRALQDGLEDLEEEEADKFVKVLIYGNSGTGKTVTATLLAQAITDKEKNILFLDSGEGWTSLENHKDLKRRVKRLRIPSLSSFEVISAAIASGIDKYDNIGTIIIDEFSTVVDSDLVRIVKEVSEAKPDRDSDIPIQQDYLKSKYRGVRYFTSLHNLPLNLITVAHERMEKDNVGRMSWAPSMNPSLGSKIRELMLVVARMTGKFSTDENGVEFYERLLQSQPSNMVTAKSRVSGIPPIATPVQFIKRLKEWSASDEGLTNTVQRIEDEETENTSTEVNEDEYTGVSNE